MKRYLLVTLLSLNALVAFSTAANTLYQMPQTNVVPIKHTVADRQYELIIKLPEKYEENSDEQYPVIYYTDAVWHIEMLSSSSAFMFKDAILVGISWQKDIDPELINDVGEYVSRFRDYSMVESSNVEHQKKYKFGQAEAHLAFIRDDVMPYVENNYRTQPDNRTYFGYSMGGEFGAYVLMLKPDTFKNYILGSPSVREADVNALKELAKSSPKNLNANVFVTFGSEELKAGRFVLDFMSLLRERDDQTLALTTAVIEGDHSGASPGTAVASMRWLSDLSAN